MTFEAEEGNRTVTYSDLKPGHRLFTRDGRKFGNAVVVRETGKRYVGEVIYEVETDFGNTMNLTRKELETIFYVDWRSEEFLGDASLEKWLSDRRENVLGREGNVTWINKPVTVRGEDFSYEATCLCSFTKTSGKVRYIVEDHGRIFVQRLEQLTFQVKEPEKPTHYVLFNGGAHFVKEAAFFESQGERTEVWGKRWRPVVSSSCEEARVLSKSMDWSRDV